MPEFDITAMVDLVFMMNIYFLVTFVTVAMGELEPAGRNACTPLDAESAVILTLTRSLDGQICFAVHGRWAERRSDYRRQHSRSSAYKQLWSRELLKAKSQCCSKRKRKCDWRICFAWQPPPRWKG